MEARDALPVAEDHVMRGTQQKLVTFLSFPLERRSLSHVILPSRRRPLLLRHRLLPGDPSHGMMREGRGVRDSLKSRTRREITGNSREEEGSLCQPVELPVVYECHSFPPLASIRHSNNNRHHHQERHRRRFPLHSQSIG